VSFHVTEAGPEDGLPVLALHGWPQHHYEWRSLLADPPGGLRVIAPDLPGYGWSGPAPHRWAKEDVAGDLLALMDELGLERVVLVGHDWGGFIGHLLTLRAPERFSAYLVLNIPHPWTTPRMLLPHVWRFLLYQPALAAFGYPLMRHTRLIELGFGAGLSDPSSMSEEEIHWFADRFRDPVCARTATDTYRTFLLREVPERTRKPETRRSTVPTLCLFGVDDTVIHVSLAAPETANAEDYQLERVEGCGHFLADERPDLLRERLITLARDHSPAHA
jgi:pimeloyl-ACP methyl ester carboxylesterase